MNDKNTEIYTRSIGKKQSTHRVITFEPLCLCGHGEWENAIKFIEWHLVFEKARQYQNASTMLNIAVCEMNHLATLNNLVNNLGSNKSILRAIEERQNFHLPLYENLKKIVIDAVCVKKAIIADYEKVIVKVKGRDCEKTLNIILEQEREHLYKFEGMLKTF